MNLDNLLFIFWIAVPVYLALKFKWLGFVTGMLAFWMIVCVCFWSRWELWDHPFVVITGFISFSVVWFVGYALKICISSKWPVANVRRLLVLAVTVLVSAVTVILMISLSLGAVDFCLSSFDRKPIFTMNDYIQYASRENTRFNGFGYKIDSFRQAEIKVGPAILYYFLPFTVNNTTEKFGVEWVYVSWKETPKEPAMQRKWFLIY